MALANARLTGRDLAALTAERFRLCLTRRVPAVLDVTGSGFA
jgi:hypothetical protein